MAKTLVVVGYAIVVLVSMSRAKVILDGLTPHTSDEFILTVSANLLLIGISIKTVFKKNPE